ncbi:MAG: LytTR family DNA-binding domain-containing protein, partial [Bacteroidota bacterium]
MTLKAIAIDDEAPALAVISKHASKLPFLSLEHTFTNPLKAISWLQTNPVDLIFLDIEMPEMRGTDFMRMMNGLSSAQFIFTTAYENYALEGFELQALDYLLKPIIFTRFASACQRALVWQSRELQTPDSKLQITNTDQSASNPTNSSEQSESDSFIFVKDGHDWVRIDFQDILYARSDGNLLFIYQSDHKVVTRMTLQHFLSIVPQTTFLRTHKSYAVSLAAIRKIERTQLVLNNGERIPLARSYRSAITESLV